VAELLDELRPRAFAIACRMQRVLYVLSLDIADGQVQGIRAVVDPDELRHLTA
jgi:hypothetical protein